MADNHHIHLHIHDEGDEGDESDESEAGLGSNSIVESRGATTPQAPPDRPDAGSSRGRPGAMPDARDGLNAGIASLEESSEGTPGPGNRSDARPKDTKRGQNAGQAPKKVRRLAGRTGRED